MYKCLIGCVLLVLSACSGAGIRQPLTEAVPDLYVTVLGVAQDAGYPQAGCMASCCRPAYAGKSTPAKVVSLGVVDAAAGRCWLIEATPDLKYQWHDLCARLPAKKAPDGVFITHAHIGHYTGLLQLGREVMGSKGMPVFCMPRMARFLSSNGPWDQLLRLNNISLQPLKADSSIRLSDRLSLTPVVVPHRDEYSETVGFWIRSARKSLLFIPDIDKWERWDKDPGIEIARADYALLDGTFFQNGELPNRDMSEVPHPFVEETMRRLQDSSAILRNKLYFIHFNHTNPLLRDGEERRHVEKAGFHVGREGQIFGL